MTTLGLLIVLAAFVSYIFWLFVLHRFTYRTWVFDFIIIVGMATALTGWAFGGSSPIALSAIGLGIAWFVITRHELKLTGSKRLELRVGDRMPAMRLLTTENKLVTEQDLIAKSPALLVFYRGWWCPSSKSQLDELIHEYENLSRAGVAIFAASVDSPSEAVPLQERVGNKITILCNVPESLLDNIGVRDQRGAPWYDRILFGAKKQDIAMPSALVLDTSGQIVFVYRSTRVDDRPRLTDVLASL